MFTVFVIDGFYGDDSPMQPYLRLDNIPEEDLPGIVRLLGKNAYLTSNEGYVDVVIRFERDEQF